MNKCPNTLCGRTGDDIGKCGAHKTCPQQAVPVEPTDIILHCDLCEITRVVPASTVIKGKAISEAHMCLSDVCECRPISTTAPAPALRAPKPASQPAKGKAKDGGAKEG